MGFCELAFFWLLRLVMKRQLLTKRFAQTLILAALLLMLIGCGGGGGGAGAESSGEEAYKAVANRTASFEYSTDTYGLTVPTLLYATENDLGLVLRVESASSLSDMWFDTNILRIDCPEEMSPGEYDIGEKDSACSIAVFDGFQSTPLETVAGSLTVETAGEWFSGEFEIMYVDRSDPEEPYYWLSASFAAPVGVDAAIANPDDTVLVAAD